MKKKIIPYPLFTARQNTKKTSLQGSQHPKKQQRIKTRINLLKVISEDIKRIKSTRKQNFPILQNLFSHKLSLNKGHKQNCKDLQSGSLHIKKINQRSYKNTIQIKSAKQSIDKNRKVRSYTVQTKKNNQNIKLSSQNVIVANKRKQFSKINEQLIFQRRQNYLNANFNRRKSRLNEITKVNKKIYDKINSQKSYYSNSQLNKSYESNSSISKRLSNSKLSHRSRLSMNSQRSINSSRCSIGSKNGQKIALLKNKQNIAFRHRQNSNKKLIKLQSRNINDIYGEQIQKFATLFPQKAQTKTKRKSSMTRKLQKVEYLKQNIYEFNQKEKMPCIRQVIKISDKNNLLPLLNSKNQNRSLSSSINYPKYKPQKEDVLTKIDPNIAVRSSRNSCNFMSKIIEEYPLTTRVPLNPNLKKGQTKLLF